MKSIRRLGIIQPGKIGDIIICLPIAKHYFERGYEIVWPLDKRIIKNFIGYVDYVTFLPIDHLDCAVARSVCIEYTNCNHILDLSFNLPGSWDKRNTALFAEHKMPFDELKYQIAEVPLEKRWENFSILRNHKSEQDLYNALNPNNEEYILTHWQGSDYINSINIEENIKQIVAEPKTESIFDWIFLLEQAKGFATIVSCFSVLIDQLNLKQPKILLSRPGGTPNYKQNWKVI